MPPYVPHKRLSSPAIDAKPATPRAKGRRSGVYDALDARDRAVASADAKRKFLDDLDNASDSSSASVSGIENVKSKGASQKAPSSPAKKRRKVEPEPAPSESDDTSSSDESSSDEDAAEEEENPWDKFIESHDKKGEQADDSDDGEAGPSKGKAHIEISLGDEPEEVGVATEYLKSKKTGPSKRDRQIRNAVHGLHVQCLLYHNYRRNLWLGHEDVHRILRGILTDGCKDDIRKWRASAGLSPDFGEDKKSQNTPSKTPKNMPKMNRGTKSQRDWGHKAQPSEASSSGPSLDPLLRMLKTLSSFWKKRFRITAPGLRKQGHKSMPRLQQERKKWQANMRDQATFGERIESFDEFKELARKVEGSRDLGAQLFTALLRSIGLEARLVSNIQPAGYGWSKAEEANPPKPKNELDDPAPPPAKKQKQTPSGKGSATKASASKTKKAAKEEATPARNQPSRGQKAKSNGTKDVPIDLSDDSSALSTPPSSDDEGSIVDVTHLKTLPSTKRYDRDLPFPVYWTEVLAPSTNTWIPVDPLVLSVVANAQQTYSVFEPRGAGADRAKQVLAYVVAFNGDGTAKDVTTRYMKNHMWPGKTKGVRVPVEKVAVRDKNGRTRRHDEYDWFAEVMRCYAQPSKKRSAADELEDGRELQPVRVQRDPNKGAGEETLQGYKNSADFVLERHLRREEALRPGSKSVKTFKTGKGDAAREEPVYKRADVLRCKTAETWHKEGREVVPGEQPVKLVNMRAVTTQRKREIEATERETGQKAQQGLFHHAQTQWIVPPPIVDGVIPKNAYGNMDVYVPSMVPAGAAHLPLRGSAKVCRKLGVDHAEACTGFEFGNRMAVPILTGVVVALENKQLVVDAWRADQEAQRKREAEKRLKVVSSSWRRMLTGLRVIERVRREYGDDAEVHIGKAMKSEMDKASRGGRRGRGGGGRSARGGRKSGASAAESIDVDGADADEEKAAGISFHDDGLGGGGFIPEGQNVEIIEPQRQQPADDDDDEFAGAGGFVLEHEQEHDANAAAAKGSSSGAPMQSLRQRMADGVSEDDEDHLEAVDTEAAEPTPTSSKRARSTPAKRATPAKRSRKAVSDSDEDEGEGLEDEFDEEPTSSDSDDDEDDQDFGSARRTRGTPRGGATRGRGGGRARGRGGRAATRTSSRSTKA